MTSGKILPGDIFLFPNPRNGKDGGNRRFDSVEIGNDSPRVSHVGPKTGFPSREEAILRLESLGREFAELSDIPSFWKPESGQLDFGGSGTR